MTSDIAILVGDRFSNFARNPEVFCISDFIGLIRLGAQVERHVCLGQGLSPAEIADLCVLLPGSATPQNSQIKADHKLTHKAALKNIMISMPRRIGEELFEADLLIDDGNEVMEDHQTGQHIQGLALIEAARQTWTAVAERFLLKDDRPARFVLESIGSTFENFVFPLPAKMILELHQIKHAQMQAAFSVRVVVSQLGRAAATIDAKFRVVNERISDRQEAYAARSAIESLLEAHTTTHLEIGE